LLRRSTGRRWPDACKGQTRNMKAEVECSSKSSRLVDEPGAEHSHALDVLLQWRLLRSAIEQIKATVPDGTGPKLAA
jgi:hypothetical protein